MKVSIEELMNLTAKTGFRPEILEKVIQLLNLLSALFSHPYLKGRLALKGGTALNLFVFNLPRLSVDIDVNYIGAVDKDAMRDERPKVEKAISDVCARENITVVRSAPGHAGGKWRLKYEGHSNQSGNLELDLNYALRIPLWPVTKRDSINLGHHTCNEIPVVNINELAAGKLAALFARGHARDIFDTPQLLTNPEIDSGLLRIGFVVYGAMNAKDWRDISIEDISLDDQEYERNLLPMLPTKFVTDKAELIADCRSQLELVLPLEENELEFVTNVRDHGLIKPSIITEDTQLQDNLLKHPGLLWRAKQSQV